MTAREPINSLRKRKIGNWGRLVHMSSHVGMLAKPESRVKDVIKRCEMAVSGNASGSLAPGLFSSPGSYHGPRGDG
jgi:hypothetical protein